MAGPSRFDTHFADRLSKIEQTKSPADDAQAALQERPGNPFNDVRVLRTARDFFYERDGVWYEDSQLDQVKDRLYEDRNNKEWNLLYAGGEYLASSGLSDAQQQRLSVIKDAWDRVPNFYDNPDRSFLDAAGDAIPALLTDPTNYLGAGTAFKGALTAARAGAGSLKAMAKGLAKPVAIEAGIGAGQEVAVNLADQGTDINIGRADGIDLGETAAAGAMGAVSGAVMSPAFNVLPAMKGSADGAALRQMDDLAADAEKAAAAAAETEATNAAQRAAATGTPEVDGQGTMDLGEPTETGQQAVLRRLDAQIAQLKRAQTEGNAADIRPQIEQAESLRAEFVTSAARMGEAQQKLAKAEAGTNPQAVTSARMAMNDLEATLTAKQAEADAFFKTFEPEPKADAPEAPVGSPENIPNDTPATGPDLFSYKPEDMGIRILEPDAPDVPQRSDGLLKREKSRGYIAKPVTPAAARARLKKLGLDANAAYEEIRKVERSKAYKDTADKGVTTTDPKKRQAATDEANLLIGEVVDKAEAKAVYRDFVNAFAQRETPITAEGIDKVLDSAPASMRRLRDLIHAEFKADNGTIDTPLGPITDKGDGTVNIGQDPNQIQIRKGGEKPTSQAVPIKKGDGASDKPSQAGAQPVAGPGLDAELSRAQAERRKFAESLDDKAQQSVILNDNKSWSELSSLNIGTVTIGGRERYFPNAQTLVSYVEGDLELRAWGEMRSKADLERVIAELDEGYALINERVGEWIKPNAKREDARKTLQRMFGKTDADSLVAASQFVDRMSADFMPQLSHRKLKDGTMGHFIPISPRNTYNEVAVSTVAGHSTPKVMTFFHEMGHWAYYNVLDSGDRQMFWSAMSKHYTDGGLDLESVKKALPAESHMLHRTNQMLSPQELFANQFSVWVMRKNDVVPDGVWKKVVGAVKTAIDRIMGRQRDPELAIDPDLEPLFSRILPDDGKIIPEINTATAHAIGVAKRRVNLRAGRAQGVVDGLKKKRSGKTNKAKDVQSPAVMSPSGLHRVIESELDSPNGRAAAFELQRREWAGDGTTQISSARITDAVAREALETRGGHLDDGVPYNAGVGTRQLTDSLRHRDSVAQLIMRKLGHRMAILDGMGTRSPMTHRDAERLMGRKGGTDDPIYDWSNDSYNPLRDKLRSISKALKDGTGVDEAVRDGLAIAFRTKAMGEARKAADQVADGDGAEFLADEVLAFYKGERDKADLFTGAGDDLDASINATVLQGFRDEIVETGSYFLNGLVPGSNKDLLPNLYEHGDMFRTVRPDTPVSDGSPATATPMMARRLADEISAMDTPSRARAKAEFAGSGLGSVEGAPITRFAEVKSMKTADGVLRPTTLTGEFGPGVYVRNEPTGEHATDDLMTRLSMDHAAAKLAGEEVADANDQLAGIAAAANEMDGDKLAPVIVSSRKHFDGGNGEPLPALGYADIYMKAIAKGYTTSARLGEVINPLEAMTGKQFHRAMLEVMGGGEQASNRFRSVLEDLGYDSIDTGDGVMVFRANQISHAASSRFDVDADELAHNGGRADVLETVLASEAKVSPDVANAVDMASEAAGTNAKQSRFQRAMLTGKQAWADAWSSLANWWRANDKRMRDPNGANAGWLANKIRDPRTNSDISTEINIDHASRTADLENDLMKLPDAGRFKAFRSKLNPMADEHPQPASHARIVGYLRGMNPTDITDAEIKLAERVRAAWNRVRDDLVKQGHSVGEIRDNYFPQLYNLTAMRRNEAGAVEAFTNYLMKEDALLRDGKMERQTAAEIASEIVRNLTDENGVLDFVKFRHNGVPGSHFDGSRAIRLDMAGPDGQLMFAEEMSQLQPFMHSNLVDIMNKYVDQGVRKKVSTERFGLGNHALRDYLDVRQAPRKAIIDMLTKDQKMPTSGRLWVDGEMVDWSTNETIISAPLKGKRQEAEAIADEILQAAQNGDPDYAYREMMSNIHLIPEGQRDRFILRADAMTNALREGGGKPSSIRNSEIAHMVQLVDLIQARPMQGGFNHESSRSASRMIRNVNSVSLLGMTTLTSLTDIGLPIIKSANLGATLQAHKRWWADPEYRQLMRNVGVGIENTMSSTISRFHGFDASRLTDAFFNITGLTPWTNAMREIAGGVGYEAFKADITKARRMYDPTKATQSAGYRAIKRRLDHYGLGTFVREGDNFFMDVHDPKLLRENTDLRRAVYQFTNDTIFTPNQNDVPLWAQTPIGAVIFQLKTFPLMMQRFTFGEGGVVPKFISGINRVRKGDMSGVSDMKPMMMMMSVGPLSGALSLAVSDLAKMRGGDDETEFALRDRSDNIAAQAMDKVLGDMGIRTNAEMENALGLLAEGAMHMGGLGLIAEMFYNAGAQADNGAWGRERQLGILFGPSVDLVSLGLKAGSAAKEAAFDDTNSDSRAFVRSLFGRAPVAGGNRWLRENLTDLVAGEQASKGSGWGGSFGAAWG
jgi:hypothetical protein